MALHLQSGGISFEGHGGSNVNLLDDYEEGTWTLACGIGTIQTADGTAPTYRKVGQIVYIKFSSTNYSDKTSGDAVVYSGFPFAATQAYYPFGMHWAYTVNTENHVYEFKTTTTAKVVAVNSGTTFESAMAYNVMQSNQNIYVMGVYESSA